MLIMLSGYKQSGKDTAAAYLVKHYGFVRASFADALKDHVAKQYNVPRELLDSPAGKETPLSNLPVVATDKFSEAIHKQLTTELQSGFWTPRALLILEGSIKRAVTPHFWILNVISQILANDRVVISDWRYRSELESLRSMELNPVTMRISRYTNILTEEASERDLDHQDFDHRLHNDQDIMGLHVQLDALMSKYGMSKEWEGPAVPVLEFPKEDYVPYEEEGDDYYGHNLWRGYMD
jgi:hypothetical protein